MRKLGKVNGEKNKELKRGWFDLKYKKEKIKWNKKAAITNKKNGTSAYYDLKIQSMGGKVAGKLNAHVLFEVNGIFQQTTLGKFLKN